MRAMTKAIGLMLGGVLIATTLGPAPAAACGGTVTVTTSGKRVLVMGDAAANCIEVSAAGPLLAVVGINGTKVDGEATDIAGKKEIVFRMRLGADEVRVFEADTPELRWIVNTQRGVDFVALGIFGFNARQLRVNMGRGNDRVDLEGKIDVNARSWISGGRGSDSLEIAVVQSLNVSGTLDLVNFESLVSLGPND